MYAGWILNIQAASYVLGISQLLVVIEVPEREHVCPPASIQQLQLLSTNKAVRALASHDIDIRNPDDYELKTLQPQEWVPVIWLNMHLHARTKIQ